ncbi:MAG: hypothetical protein ISS79_01765 [Phycisphaerae bacterium]|nr:hypothetical protein [Phycisphaerae bacterium]
MTVLNKYFLTALLVLFLVGQGCKTPLTKRSGADRSAWGRPTWGPLSEGLQCRLRPDRRTWRLDETPAFNFDLRNRGKRTFAFWPAHKLELTEIEFDGKWRRWPTPVMIDSHVWPLAPGAQYNAVTINLDRRFGIDIRPGKHIVRIAFNLEGVRVVSNPVGIEILRPK